jgi:hypothetical protein
MGWILLSVIYLVLLCTVAVLTFRKGHWILGLIGFIFPLLWLIGAVLPAVHHRRH